jgi:hypothetical protein
MIGKSTAYYMALAGNSGVRLIDDAPQEEVSFKIKDYSIPFPHPEDMKDGKARRRERRKKQRRKG